MASEQDSAARRIVLSRIRSALLPHAETPDAAESWAAIPRAYRRGREASREAIVQLFIERLHDYDAQVLRCERSGVAQAVQALLRARGMAGLLVPDGFPAAWLPAGFDAVRDAKLPAAALDACPGVITTCTLGIAETGTIVLQNAPGQGRRAVSLVPDYHLCVIRAESVLATVPEAMAALQSTASLPTTFVSGPSATADIEMTRIKGVHGPRFLDVVVVGEAPGDA
jgi:L-lactate dehydrogenase complex protein LldG